MDFMNLLQTAPAGSPLISIGMIVLMLAVLYFLMIRPQQKEQKKFQEMLKNLKKGDRVITAGGIYGTISSVKDNSFILKIDDNCKIEVSKNGIGSIIDAKAKAAAESANPSNTDKNTEKENNNK